MNKEIKDYLSKDYKKFHKQIIHLEKITTEKEFFNYVKEI